MAPTIMPFKGGFSFDFLGPRPAGDPHALLDLANDLRTQAAAWRGTAATTLLVQTDPSMLPVVAAALVGPRQAPSLAG